jgi:hypothetical protein
VKKQTKKNSEEPICTGWRVVSFVIVVVLKWEKTSSVSGVSDYLAVSDVDALRKTREVVSTLNIQPSRFVPQAHWMP